MEDENQSMSTDQYYGTDVEKLEELDFNRKVLDFVKALDSNLNAGEVKVLDVGYKKTADYLPIQTVENKLDYYFGGLWQVKNFKYNVIVNEIAGDLELGVWHPILKQWIWRSGAAGTQIQLRVDYEKNEAGREIKDPNGKKIKIPNSSLDVDRKIINTVQKDLPRLKTECIKNAAKSFGRTFGRSLNRVDEEFAGAIIDNLQSIEEVLKKMADCATLKELTVYYSKLDDIQKKDKRIQNLFSSRRAKLKNDENS